MNDSADPFGIPPEQEPIEDVTTTVTEPAPKRRGMKVAIISFASVLVLGGGGALAALNWFSNNDQSVAERIPADVGIYIGIDALKLQDENTKAVVSTISQMVEDLSGEETSDVTFDMIDEEMRKELGFDFSNDIKPWVGRSMALFAMPIEGIDPASTAFQPDFEGAFVVQVRDAGQADAFIEKASKALADNGQVLQTVDHGGVSFLENDTMALVHFDGIMSIGDPATIRRLIDVTPETSLAGSEDFAAITAQLPAERLLTMYLSADFFELPASSFSALPITTLASTGGSLTIVPAGIRFDAATKISGNPGADLYQSMFGDATGEVASVFPAGIYGFFVLPSLADIWQAIGEAAPEDVITGSVESAVAELGYDPFDRLVPLLDGGTGVAVLPGETATPDFPIGVAATFGTSDPARLGSELDSLMTALGTTGVPLVKDGDVYTAEGVVIGVVDDRLQITFNTPFDGIGQAPSILDDATYTAAIGSLDGLQPYVYIDTGRIVADVAGDPSVTSALKPLGPIVGAQGIKGDWALAAMVIHLDYANS